MFYLCVLIDAFIARVLQLLRFLFALNAFIDYVNRFVTVCHVRNGKINVVYLIC